MFSLTIQQRIKQLEFKYPDCKVREICFSNDGGYYHYLEVYKIIFFFFKKVIYTENIY